MRNWLEIASVADHKGMIHQRVRGRNLCLLQRGRKFRFVLHFINLLYKDLIQSFDLMNHLKGDASNRYILLFSAIM